MDPEFNFPNLKFITYNDFFQLKKDKIVDCFTFYNELDMLNYRLNTLHNVVDYFILVESTLTHVGRPKPLYYQENKSLFEKFNHKIVHVVVDDFPFNESNIDCKNNDQWINEKFQRNSITRGLNRINLNENDIILISDVDEIPNPETLKLIENNQITIETCMQFEQDFYYYNIESKMDHNWYFAKIFKWKWFLTTDFTLDDLRMKPWYTIPNGGWHLSYFGTPEFISNKIKNFAHQEFNNDNFTDTNLIESRIKNGIDVYNRDIKIIKVNIKENKLVPPYYNLVYCFIHSCNLGNLERLNHLMDRLKCSGIVLKTIFITNIGKPLENRSDAVVENYSNDPNLFEIPTINRIIEFSKQNPYDNVLYLHTKGVLHKSDYQELNDWIDLMLYFLLKNENKTLLNRYDCIGCNYKQQPKLLKRYRDTNK
jgi:beta-1,4-mannosyl-glycoprotein beta-1,4-N-acetylglucosaminyltransferase